MLLSAAVLTIENGELRLERMRSVSDLPLPPFVGRDPDVEALWSTQDPEGEWRMVNLSPRFPATGDLVTRMWVAAGQPPVDGAMAVDPVTVRNLLRVVGAQQVGDLRIDERNALRYFFLDQYRGLGLPSSQDVRRDGLSDVVESLVATLERGDYEPGALLNELSISARGRHVLAWSRRASEQRAWEVLGVDGDVDPESMLVSIQNRGGNKLDQFLEVGGDISTRANGAGTDVSVTLTLDNQTPDNLAPYVSGPPENLYVQEKNLYVGLASITVPGDATQIRLEGGTYTMVTGPDGNNQVTVAWLEIPQGEQRELRLTYRLPGAVRKLRIDPSARVPPIEWTARDQKWTDGSSRTIEW
jgi:hypothetical protein